MTNKESNAGNEGAIDFEKAVCAATAQFTICLNSGTGHFECKDPNKHIEKALREVASRVEEETIQRCATPVVDGIPGINYRVLGVERLYGDK